jgi:hypothetical protein
MTNEALGRREKGGVAPFQLVFPPPNDVPLSRRRQTSDNSQLTFPPKETWPTRVPTLPRRSNSKHPALPGALSPSGPREQGQTTHFPRKFRALWWSSCQLFEFFLRVFQSNGHCSCKSHPFTCFQTKISRVIGQ